MTRLLGFAYGEQLEGVPPRSLGFRLLRPREPEPWTPEIEELARLLQAAPFPETWLPVELFCSVILEDGRRLVGAARYGLTDRTASQRHGGLEMIGVVGPGSLGVLSALALYEWIKQGQARADATLEDALAAVPPVTVQLRPVSPPVVCMKRDDVVLFEAMTPEEPDRALGLLEQTSSSHWQWLPLVSSEFPWAKYGSRGPLIAWSPSLC